MLEYCSERLRANREIVTAAINQDGRALEFASEEYKKDVEMVKAAIIKSGKVVLDFCNDEVKKNEVILTILDIRKNPF